MGRSALIDVVQIGGLALQSEDCAIRAAVAHRGEFGGIIRMENERYHQFVIWRALLPLWDAHIERQARTDLILCDKNINHYFEIKNWRQGNNPDLKTDIEKLSNRSHGYIVVSSGQPAANRSHNTESNIKHYISGFESIDRSSLEVFKFLTENRDKREIEYWVAGWRLGKKERMI